VPWAESITKASGGTIKFDFYPSQQLGKAKDHFDMARDGIADVIWTNPGYSPGRFPVAAAGELPFHFSNAVSGSRAWDGWYRRNNAEEMKDVKYCFAHVHDPGAIHTKEKITHPDQMKGKKVRPGNATMARFAKSLGGASVQVSAPESRDALAKGTADLITFPWNSLRLFGIDKVTTHHLDMPLYVVNFVIVFNKSKYESMSTDQRAVIDDHCNSDWAEKVAKGWADWEAQGRLDTIADATQFVHTPTTSEVEAWRAAAAPLHDEWKAGMKRTGLDADALYTDLVKTLKKHDALYE
jgi:TRAP-type C4-dicarboxylate transport system substrate-binding protein